MFARLCLSLIVCLTTATLASSQDRTTRLEILPGSQYTYFAGFAPLPDCDGNDDLQCEFQIEGEFTLLEDFSSGSASIVDAEITLTSFLDFDPEPFPLQLVTGERVAGFLEGEEFQGIPTIPEDAAYQSTTDPGASDPLIVTYQILNGENGSLYGGYNFSAVDGDGVSFVASLRVLSSYGVFGDADFDGDVDGDDLIAVQTNFGGLPSLGGDADGDRDVDGDDLIAVQTNFGAGVVAAVPEPTAGALAALAWGLVVHRRVRR